MQDLSNLQHTVNFQLRYVKKLKITYKYDKARQKIENLKSNKIREHGKYRKKNYVSKLDYY